MSASQANAHLKAFFKSGKTLPVTYRKQALKALRDSVRKHEPLINKALTEDFNKPPFETFITEIGLVYAEISHALRHINDWTAPARAGSSLITFPAKHIIYQQPHGASLIIAPWNYPVMLTLIPLVSAIAAGCSAFVKPSELTPATAKVIKMIIDDAFHNEGYICDTGSVDYTTALLEEQWDHIFFTGSIPVGKIVMQAAAKHLTPVTLELGGKSPAIIHKDAKVKLAAKRVAWGKITNAGQTCVAPDYLYVHKDIYNDFIAELKITIESMLGENPLHAEDYPSVINEKHYNRLKAYLNGNKIIYGGQTDDRTRKIAPTLLEAPEPASPVMQEEIFGPLLPVYRYTDSAEPITFIQSRPRPLSLYLFTENKRLQQDIITQIPFGGGCINDTMLHVGTPKLPFGGSGSSGMGLSHGYWGFQEFSHMKSIVHRSTFLELPLRFRPYKEKWLKVIRRLLK